MTIAILYFTRSIVLMLVGHIIVFISLIALELIYVNKTLCRIRLEFDATFCFNLLKEAFPTIFGAAAEYLSLKSDILVLTLILGDTATGIYSVSSNIYIAASFIPLAIAKAATPIFNRMIVMRQRTGKLVKKSFILMFLSSIILIVAIILLGKWGIVVLWGEEFGDAAIPLYILAISLLFMPVNRFLEYMLIGMRQQLFVAKCSIVGAVGNIIANIILVPILGINAVAITTVFTELFVMLFELIHFGKIIKRY